MILNQLKKQIIEKENLSNKINLLEQEKAKYQKEISIITQEHNEEKIILNKLEKSIIVFNRENKIFQQEENIRKLKSKLKTLQYQYNLLLIDLDKNNQRYNDIKDCDILYDQELKQQILNIHEYPFVEIKDKYLKIKEDNHNYLHIINEANKMIDCLKKMDLYYTRPGDYSVIEKRYTLGNTTWVVGSPSVDIYNLQKEIVTFEEPLKRINILKEDIDQYFIYSKDFFENALSLLGAQLSRINDYSLKIIDFKRDISNITNKIRNIYEENIIKEKEYLIQLEKYLIKK